MIDESGSGKVSYTVKELIEKVDHKLDKIVEQIATKAEAHDLAKVVARVEKLEDDSASASLVEEYRRQQHEQRKVDHRWRVAYASGTLVSVSGLIAGVASRFF